MWSQTNRLTTGAAGRETVLVLGSPLPLDDCFAPVDATRPLAGPFGHRAIVTAALLRFRKSATHGGHFVAIGIAHVSSVEARPVLRPQPRSTVTHASVGEGSRVKVIDSFP